MSCSYEARGMFFFSRSVDAKLTPSSSASTSCVGTASPEASVSGFAKGSGVEMGGYAGVAGSVVWFGTGANCWFAKCILAPCW